MFYTRQVRILLLSKFYFLRLLSPSSATAPASSFSGTSFSSRATLLCASFFPFFIFWWFVISGALVGSPLRLGGTGGLGGALPLPALAVLHLLLLLHRDEPRVVPASVSPAPRSGHCLSPGAPPSLVSSNARRRRWRGAVGGQFGRDPADGP